MNHSFLLQRFYFVLTILFTLLSNHVNAQNPAWVNLSTIHYLNSITEEGDTLWLATDGGLIQWDKKNSKPSFFNTKGKGALMASLNCLALGKNGVKWLGTDGLGLVRYDGNQTRLFNQHTEPVLRYVNSIKRIAIDQQENVWATNSAVIYKITPQLSVTQEALMPSGVSINAIVIDSSNNIWLGTSSGLYRYKDTLIPYTSSSLTILDNVTSLGVGKSGELMIGCDKWNNRPGGFFTLKDGKIQQHYMNEEVKNIHVNSSGIVTIGSTERIKTYDGNNVTIKYNFGNIFCAMTDREGQIWFGTPGYTLKKVINGTLYSAYDIRNSMISGNNIKDIQMEKGKQPWISTLAGFVAYGGLNTIVRKKWKVYDPHNSLSLSPDPFTLFIDSKNNKWIGGNQGHLVKFDGLSVTKFEEIRNVFGYSPISAIQEDSLGNIWIHSGILSKYDGKNFTHLRSNYELPPANGFNILIHDKTFWVPSSNGLFQYISGNWVQKGNPAMEYTNFHIDNKGRQWFSYNGLYRNDGLQSKQYTTANSPIPNHEITYITSDFNGTVWLACYGGFLVSFDGNSWKIYSPQESGIPSEHIQVISIDSSNNKWIGTNHGMVVFNESGVKFDFPLPPSQDPDVSMYLTKLSDTLLPCKSYGLDLPDSLREDAVIWFSHDKGLHWERAGYGNRSNNFVLNVPDISSDQCLVRLVTVAGNDTISSPGTFSVKGSGSRSLDLLQPENGEIWNGAEKKEIRWTTAGSIPYVNLSYSIDEGKTWNTFANNIENTGKYTWTVPSVASSKALVSVNDPANCVYSLSRMPFTILEKPYILLTSSNSGSPLKTGTITTIRWSTNLARNTFVNITYSSDSGRSWKVIKESAPNIGTFQWTVPDVQEPYQFLKIASTNDPLLFDISDESFPIVKALIDIKAPTYGQAISSCSTVTVNWESLHGYMYAELFYTIDQGKTWIYINYTQQNEGTNSFQWIPPAGFTGNISLKVSDGEYGKVIFDTISVYVTQPSAYTLNTPNGGEIWETGTSQTIHWSSDANAPASVKVEYSPDAGKTWQSLYSNILNEGSVPWTIPNTFSSKALIRVSSLMEPCKADQSNEVFSISSSTVWPGDADNNGVVNIHDLLPLGVYFGEQGYSRDSVSILWQGQNARKWNKTQSGGQNLMHADSDGNGRIEAGDTLAIKKNYGKVQNQMYRTAAAETQHSSNLLFDKSHYISGEKVSVTLLIADSLHPIRNLYGISFKCNFDAALVEPGSIGISFKESIFSIDDEPLLLTNTSVHGEIHAGIVNTSGKSSAGYGQVAEITFRLSSIASGDIVIGIQEMKAITIGGESIEIGTVSGTGSVSDITSTSTGDVPEYKIFPNPSEGIVWIEDKQEMSRDFLVKDIFGRKVNYEMITEGNVVQLIFGEDCKGVYFLTNAIKKDKVYKLLLR